MGYLSPQETDLLKLPSNPDYWVRFRKKAPWGVRIASQGSMLKITTTRKAEDAEGNGGVDPADPSLSVVTEAEWAAYIRALVLGFITEWNLTDAEDRPLAISAENLDLLEDSDGQYLAGEAQARSKPRSAKAEKNSGRPSRSRSSKTRK